jgi:hypothetical protein
MEQDRAPVRDDATIPWQQRDRAAKWLDDSKTFLNICLS